MHYIGFPVYPETVLVDFEFPCPYFFSCTWTGDCIIGDSQVYRHGDIPRKLKITVGLDHTVRLLIVKVDHFSRLVTELRIEIKEEILILPDVGIAHHNTGMTVNRLLFLFDPPAKPILLDSSVNI